MVITCWLRAGFGGQNTIPARTDLLPPEGEGSGVDHRAVTFQCLQRVTVIICLKERCVVFALPLSGLKLASAVERLWRFIGLKRGNADMSLRKSFGLPSSADRETIKHYQ